MCDEVCFANLVDMCGITNTAFNVLQVHTATSENDTAKEFVGIVRWYLHHTFLNDFANTCLNDFNELTALYGTF